MERNMFCSWRSGHGYLLFTPSSVTQLLYPLLYLLLFELKSLYDILFVMNVAEGQRSLCDLHIKQQFKHLL